MVKCSRCGNTFDEQYGVCPYCGLMLVPGDYSDQKPASDPEKKKNQSKKPLIVLICILAAVLIIGIVICIAVLSSKKGPTEYEQQISLGEKYLSEEKYDDAIIAFRKAIEIDPNDPDAYLGLADVYIAMGNDDEAIRVLEEGLEHTDSDKIREKIESMTGYPGLKIGIEKYDEDWEYPVFTTGDRELKEFLDTNIAEKIKEVPPDSDSSGKIEYLVRKSSVKYNYVGDGYLSMQWSSTVQRRGTNGMPQTNETTCFVDLKEKKMRGIFELFTEDKETVSDELAQKLKKYAPDTIYESTDFKKQVKNNIKFMVTNDSIIFPFGSRTIASGVAGPITITIPMSDIDLTFSLRGVKNDVNETLNSESEVNNRPDSSDNEKPWETEYNRKLHDFYIEYNERYTSPRKIKYDIYDLDGDNIPELIISEGDYHAAGCRIYSYVNSELRELGKFGEWGTFSFYLGRNIIYCSWANQGHFISKYYEIKDHEMYLLCSYGFLWREKYQKQYEINEKTVTEEEYNEYVKENSDKIPNQDDEKIVLGKGNEYQE